MPKARRSCLRPVLRVVVVYTVALECKANLSCLCVSTYLCSCQLNNPDMRVVIIKDFVQSNFPATPLVNYAMEVEKITTSKVHVQCINLCYVLYYTMA